MFIEWDFSSTAEAVVAILLAAVVIVTVVFV